MNHQNPYEGYAEFNTFYFGEEDQWKEVFNYVVGISQGKENKTPFFLLVGEEGLGKKKLFEKVCYELSSSGGSFQASDPIDMADKGKNPADYVESLQEKEKHFELSAMTLSFGVPLLKFFSPRQKYLKTWSSRAICLKIQTHRLRPTVLGILSCTPIFGISSLMKKKCMEFSWKYFRGAVPHHAQIALAHYAGSLSCRTK